ncbi:MAG: sugar ABC transporter ATP-binding protein [Anaerolineae bacterium]|nr:sugar ABC transporter ATP-binding protein [Anaerolineae bacterium]
MLEIKAVSKRFPGVQALRNVSFTVQQGEVHALVGENGAGKSTLMKILSGVYTDYEGQLLLDQQVLILQSPRDAQRHGIAIIHQELNLIPELTITENIFLGRELYTRLHTLDTRRMDREASYLLSQLNLNIAPSRSVRTLRVGEQQLVEVAKALSLNARLLILDEPTSALSETEIEHLFEVIATLKQQGVTMIYISHKLDEIYRIADRVTVLRDGEYIGTTPIDQISVPELIRKMVGRNLNDLFPKERVTPGQEVLQVENLSLQSATRESGYALKDISFSVRRGEILGITGLMGAGRTELLEVLFGMHPARQVGGEMSIAGKKQTITSPQQALKAGLAFVTEDRKNQSLIVQHSVGHNMTLAAMKRFLWFNFIQSPLEKEAMQEMTRKLHIKTAGYHVPVDTLSGGNQQKVVLAKCLLTQPDVLLLDEPTRGIDVGAKAEIYTLISQLAKEGTAIIMVSSELPEILAMCDRVLVLCEGRVTGTFNHDEVSQEMIMEAATARQRTRD